MSLIATGAHERPIVFADNDLPGIMLAHSARTFLHRYGVMVGRKAVVFTTNDSAYAAAFDLADAGVQIEMMVDARAQVPDVLGHDCDQRGIPVRAGAVVTGTRGDDRITDALIADFDGVNIGTAEAVSCDALLVSGGWNPAVHLFSQARGVLRYDDGAWRLHPWRAPRRGECRRRRRRCDGPGRLSARRPGRGRGSTGRARSVRR